MQKWDWQARLRAFARGIHPWFFATAVVFVLVFAWDYGFLKLGHYTARVFDTSYKHYSQVYSFVPETLSKSAPITITLPEDIESAGMEQYISFDPAIVGTWVKGEEASQLIFQPEAPLTTEQYYAVALEAPEVGLKGDFKVVEDPVIEAVFPAAMTEANEYSDITIVFSRPMVPLTTLTEQEEVPLPIIITPETPGRFKWISTRNLQFIPETRLQRSSTYTVSVGAGLTSIEGVPVPPAEFTFVVRPLRYETLSQGNHPYNRPFVIRFNQPVSLEETQNLVHIERQAGSEREPVPFEVTYGRRDVYNRDSKKYEEIEDVSQLWFYPKADSHGRERLWDFETRYQVRVSGAAPFEGDVRLTETKQVQLIVPEFIRSVTARSERSDSVRPDLFDPEGELLITFVEPVDIGRTTIRAKGLTDMVYDMECARDDDGRIIYDAPGECREVEKKDTIVLSFDPSVFGRGEQFDVVFERIVNEERLTVNAQPMVRSVTTYPELKVLRTYPAQGGSNGNLTKLEICSNTPLAARSDEEYQNYLTADNYLVFGSWYQSRYIQPDRVEQRCAGSFLTTINYGLHPQEAYQLQLTLEDEFGQSAGTQTLSFTTAPPNAQYVRFQNLQKIYNVTTPDRTTLTYVTENLESVDMTICELSAREFIQVAIDGVSRQSAQPAGCQSVVQDRIELPKRYWVNNYFQVKLSDYVPDPRGHYVVSFGQPLMKDRNGRYYDHTYVSVTNLAVAEKRLNWDSLEYRDLTREQRSALVQSDIEEAFNLYWVTRIGSLAAVPNAQVTTFAQAKERTPLTLDKTSATDASGISRQSVAPDIVGAVISAGDEQAVVIEDNDRLQYAGGVYSSEYTYIYTDRPLYRPGHKVEVRGIDRVAYDGEHRIGEGQTPTLKVYNNQREEIFSEEVTINQYGTFASSFEIPADAALGTYFIEVLGRSAYFSVEEYQPAPFKVEAKSNDTEYINGDTFSVDLLAEYYFGVPVANAKVTYTVTAQDYYFDRYEGEYFNFGRGWYYCYSCGYGDRYLFRGETTTDGNGQATIEEEFDLARWFEDVEDERSKIVAVAASVMDESGKSVASQASFIVHKGEMYVGAKATPGYGGVGTESQLRVKTVDTEGTPIAKRGVEVTLERVEWNSYRRREVDGGFYYQSEEIRTPVLSEQVATDRNGDASLSYTFTEEGRFEMTVRATDERGNVSKATTNLYVWGNGAVRVEPTNNYELKLQSERQDFSIGDEARIIVESPYQRAKALITVERGEVFDYWVTDVNSNLFDYALQMKREYSPNAFVSVTLISPDPEVKYGNLEFTIERDLKQLLIDMVTNKESYLPGEEVTLDITTKDKYNNPQQSEVSVAVADLSVLALKGNPKKDPLRYFYPGFALRVLTASNLKHILYEREIPKGSKGGGGDPEDLEKKKRGEFKDTAFWRAQVETDASGKARLTFRLPDNLTTWQIETLGVTKDTKVGVAYKEFLARKRLMTIPLKPRFVIPGDAFSLGATVFNQTDKAQAVTVSIESDTLTLPGETSRTIRLEPEENRIVYFEAKAPLDRREGTHTFTVGAVNDDVEDVVEQTIKITPNNTYEAVATAHFTKDDAAKEFVYIPDVVEEGRGGLTINTNATMAVFVSGALDYLIEYPYGCSEQLASKLGSIAVVKRGLAIENVGSAVELEDVYFEGNYYSPDEVVSLGVKRLYQNQQSDGGFAYYAGLRSSPYLTLHVLSALQDLRDAGYEIDLSVMRKAASYLRGDFVSEERYYSNDRKILTTYVLDRTGLVPDADMSRLHTSVQNLIRDELYLEEQISSLTLSYLALLTLHNAYSPREYDRVYEALEARIAIDGRGAYVRSIGKEGRLWQFYESPVKNTAMLLKVFALQERENVITDKVLRWLMNSREKDGAWGSTNATLATIDAMTDYLVWQRETEAEFELTTKLDESVISEESFSAETILTTRSTFVPIDTFKRNQLQTVSFERTRTNDVETNFYYDMLLKYYLPTEQIPPRDEGLTVERALYARDDIDFTTPLYETSVGEVLKGRLVVTVPQEYSIVAVEDYIPAGFELVNFDLATEDKTLLEPDTKEVFSDARGHGRATLASGWRSLGMTAGSLFGFAPKPTEGLVAYDERLAPKPVTRVSRLYPDVEELRDDRIFLFSERISPGVYVYEYYVRATTPGTFQYLPAIVSQMYYPEIFGRTDGNLFTVKPKSR